MSGHKKLATLIILLICAACGEKNTNNEVISDNDKKLEQIYRMYRDYKKNFPEVKDIDAQKLVELLKEQEIILVDVREPREQKISKLPEALTQEQFEQGGFSKEKVIVCYCTIGMRSGLYAKKLQEQKWKVYNLRGSILAWTHAGQKLFNEKGETRTVHVYGEKWNLVALGYQGVW